MSTDNFFSSLSNTKPYLKIGFEGFAGSGKTYTAAQLAIGLHKRIASPKPVVLFDTEEAAKFLRRTFDEHGITVLHKRSRSLADLQEAMRRCRDGAADFLVIDSITHIWENFLQAYLDKKGRKSGKLQFEDWGVIKPTWKKDFSDPFVRDPYHCLMTGRAGWEYESEEVEVDDGQGGTKMRREIHKSGVKMKAETETAFEPDLLVLMTQKDDLVDAEKKTWREAFIRKDRSTMIDGKTFKFTGDDPPGHTYALFAPALEYILENPVTGAAAVATERSAKELFETDEDRRRFFADREILLEKIQGEMISAWPSTSAAEKKGRSDALFAALGTRSWKEVEKMDLVPLRAGLEKMTELARKASGAADVVVTSTTAAKDEAPPAGATGVGNSDPWGLGDGAAARA